MKKEYIIDESKWMHWSSDQLVLDRDRDGTYYYSTLYNHRSGKSCCLGLIGIQCGVERGVMEDELLPYHLPEDYAVKFPYKLQIEDGTVMALTQLNDKPLEIFETMSDRQVKMVKLFAEIDVTIRFVTGKEDI